MTSQQAVPWLRETEVFTSGAEGYHTFRIPSLAITSDGTILAFCEGRRHGQHDYDALYLVLKRSTDNGVTWGPLQLLYGNGENTFHNPTVVVDRDTGRVFLTFNRDAFRCYVMHSDDNGATWSEAVDITDSIMPSNWTHYVMAPGKGIQMKSGRLAIPAGHHDSHRMDSIFSHSHMFYSDDHGASWQVGGALPGGSNECEMVETTDGSLYMAVRAANRQLQKRLCAWSKDGGETWSDLIELDELTDAVCQASIVRYTDAETHDKNRIIFGNLDSTTRDHFTLRVSYDECQTWATKKVLYTGPSAYSDMAIAPDMTICCLYERGSDGPYESLRLAQFNLAWLTDGADQLEG